MRAGLIGAVAATVVGTLANDSGALLLEIGTAYLLVFAGFAWAESGRVDAAPLGVLGRSRAEHATLPASLMGLATRPLSCVGLLWAMIYP